MLTQKDLREIGALREIRALMAEGLAQSISGSLCGSKYTFNSVEELDELLDVVSDIDSTMRVR